MNFTVMSMKKFNWTKKINQMSPVLIFGTYEGGVVAFDVEIEKDSDVKMTQLMSTPCHIGCVRSAASAGRYAVTGGTDELINVFDMAKRCHLGNMGGSVHTSTITALAVSDKPGMMVSGCEDGQIAITRIKDFQTLKSFKGHKSSILGISIHPSGKMALSISSDNTLRMWDLTRGTCAAIRTVCPVKRPNTGRGMVSMAHMDVRYTPQGSRYVILLPGGKIEICSSSSMDVATLEGGITAIVPLSEDVFLAGDNKGTLSLLRLQDASSISVVSELPSVHSSRMRGIARLDATHAASVCAQGKLVISCFDESSFGLRELKSIETGMRVTALSSSD